MLPNQVLWLIDCEPRAVQQEALLRSYYGYASRDNRHDEPKPVKLREGAAEGWGHFLEMRLGKTPTALNEMALFNRDHGFRKFVVLSPNSYKSAWVKEAAVFGMDIPFFAYETSRSNDAVKFIQENYAGSFCLVVNYEALQYDNTREILKWVVDKDCMLVADESIKIKNHTSITFKRALELSKEAGAIRELTGCPMTQGPQDMYAQLKFIRGLDGKNFYSFRNRFCKMGGFKNKKIVGIKNEEELKETIHAMGFVAKRKDWGNPHQSEHYVVDLEIKDEQKKHYDAMNQDFVTMLDTGEEISAEQVVSKMMKLQQISSGFLYNEKGEGVKLMDLKNTPKMQRLKEMLEDEVEGKAIICYHYGYSGDALLETFEKWNPAVIRGKQWMNKNERDLDEEKKRFNEDDDCRLIILQISAGKYGHNLSGVENDRCKTMFFYENTYSLDDRIQIEMRNTAAFQDWQNVYFDLVTTEVERKAIKALQKKESIVEAVLGHYERRKV